MNYLNKNKQDKWYKEDVVKKLKANTNKKNQLIEEFLKKINSKTPGTIKDKGRGR